MIAVSMIEARSCITAPTLRRPSYPGLRRRFVEGTNDAPTGHPPDPGRADRVSAAEPQMRAGDGRPARVSARRGDELPREGRRLLHDVIRQGAEGLEHP